MKKKQRQRKRPQEKDIDSQTLEEWIALLRMHHIRMLSDVSDAEIGTYLIEQYDKTHAPFTPENIDEVDVMDIVVQNDIRNGKITLDEKTPEHEKINGKTIAEIAHEICEKGVNDGII